MGAPSCWQAYVGRRFWLTSVRVCAFWIIFQSTYLWTLVEAGFYTSALGISYDSPCASLHFRRYIMASMWLCLYLFLKKLYSSAWWVLLLCSWCPEQQAHLQWGRWDSRFTEHCTSALQLRFTFPGSKDGDVSPATGNFHIRLLYAVSWFLLFVFLLY